MNVWGAGESVSQKWYGRGIRGYLGRNHLGFLHFITSGCRTMEDIASLPDLTSMQRIGIKWVPNDTLLHSAVLILTIGTLRISKNAFQEMRSPRLRPWSKRSSFSLCKSARVGRGGFLPSFHSGRMHTPLHRRSQA